MDFKVINIDGEQVCIHRDRSAEGYEFDTFTDAQRFVRDYSGRSAHDFLMEQYREIGAASALEGGKVK